MPIFYIGLDDTDTLESRGTGSLARQIATQLAEEHEILGVTRHQLLLDDRIPYTAKNSCAAICLEINGNVNIQHIFGYVCNLILNNFQPGSDPGVCLAREQEASSVTKFGKRAKTEIVTQEQALELAALENIRLSGLGGSHTGIIGALAAVGLASWGEDGRYIQIGSSRDLRGMQPVPIVMGAGIHAIQTMDNQVVKGGFINTDKLRPARRKSKPVLYVERDEDHWNPLKLD